VWINCWFLVCGLLSLVKKIVVLFVMMIGFLFVLMIIICEFWVWFGVGMSWSFGSIL